MRIQQTRYICSSQDKESAEGSIRVWQVGESGQMVSKKVMHIYDKQCEISMEEFKLSNSVFSVTRRSRSDAVHLLTDYLMVSIDLTDVTLVSDDT